MSLNILNTMEALYYHRQDILLGHKDCTSTYTPTQHKQSHIVEGLNVQTISIEIQSS